MSHNYSLMILLYLMQVHWVSIRSMDDVAQILIGHNGILSTPFTLINILCTVVVSNEWLVGEIDDHCFNLPSTSDIEVLKTCLTVPERDGIEAPLLSFYARNTKLINFT